jgi:group I intron endonuclease
MNTFIYALCEPGTRIIRYIGKVNDIKKRLKSHSEDSVRYNTHRAIWMRKILASGLKPEALILKSVPMKEWQEWEMSYIRNARMLGFDLVNKLSPESRKKLSESIRGEKHYGFGKKRSEETRYKISLALRGNKSPNFGKKFSEETIQKLSIAATFREAKKREKKDLV